MSSRLARRRRSAPAPDLHGPVLCDFESRSRASLKKRGGRLYWEDPSSEAICAVLYDVRRDEWHTWAPGAPPPRIHSAVAHNAKGFDRHAATRSGWHVEEWIDSSELARRAGLPGALDALGSRWAGKAKDKAASKFTVSLSRASRAKARLGQLPELTRDIVRRVLEYCASDVEILAETWDRLEPWVDVEPEVAAVDTIINDRGIYLDRELVVALQEQLRRQSEKAVRRSAKALGQSYETTRAQAMSPAQLTEATGLPNAQKETLADRATHGKLLDHPLVSARLALASVVPGKLTAALNMVSEDNRLRDMFLYIGAHTWRWSGRGLQPHNLNRISFEDDAKAIEWHVDDYIEALIDGAHTGADLTKRQVSGLLRSVLTAAPGHELAVQDYSGIEARVNAWAAGDEDALKVFRALDAGTGTDPYRIMATDIFGISLDAVEKHHRQIGKNAELGCGYGMGADAFDVYCENAGNDLAAMGVRASDVIDAWRKKHAPIVRMWKDCERAFAAACEGRKRHAGRWHYEAHPAASGSGGVDVWCVMPSGSPIVYPDARAKRVQRRTKNGRTFMATDLTFQGRRFREHVYGGKLVENAVQRFSRELLADALVRFEAAGLEPVGHVHDEGICQVTRGLGAEALAEMHYIMGETAPRWAEGLPIRLDGFHSVRYRK